MNEIMYERKIPVDLGCPLRLTMSLIGSKWKSCILDELRNKVLRPSELHKIFPEATPRVLDLQLKELVEDGLVSKTVYPELPPRSEYAITALGQTLIPIIDAMIEWGNQHTDLFMRKYGSGMK
jgi:DNA-binding HxlR family transcriptional regulator